MVVNAALVVLATPLVMYPRRVEALLGLGFARDGDQDEFQSGATLRQKSMVAGLLAVALMTLFLRAEYTMMPLPFLLGLLLSWVRSPDDLRLAIMILVGVYYWAVAVGFCQAPVSLDVIATAAFFSALRPLLYTDYLLSRLFFVAAYGVSPPDVACALAVAMGFVFHTKWERRAAFLQGKVHTAQLEGMASAMDGFKTSATVFVFEMLEDGAIVSVYSDKSMLGYPGKALEGQNGWSFIHPDDVAKLGEDLKDVPMKDRPPQTYRKRHKDGHWVWLRGEIVSVRPGAGPGKPVRYVVREENVSAFKEKEELEVRRAAAQMTRRLDLVPSMVYEFEIDETTGKATFPWVSPASVGIYGKTPEEMHDATVAAGMCHPDDVASFSASVEASHKTMTKWEWQGRLVVDGTDKVIQCASMPVRRGSVVRWTGVVQDVTETCRMTKALAQDAVLRTIYADMPGTITLELRDPGSPHERIVWIAGRTETITGYTKDEWVALALNVELVHPESLSDAEAVCKAVAAGATVPIVELRYLHKNGSPMWLMPDKISRRLENGHHLVVLHDVTALVNLRAMTKERDLHKALAERFQSGCQFLAHEIRNKLHPQSASLRVLRDVVTTLRPEDWQDRAQDIDCMLESGTSISDLLTRVLDVAKWDANAYPTTVAFFYPKETVFAGLAHFGHASALRWAPTGAVAFQMDTSGVTNRVAIQSDKTVLVGILENLVSNACKCTETGHVVVKAWFAPPATAAGDAIQDFVVTVTDTGRGMCAAGLATALKAFGQIRKGSDQETGTGLGLPLSAAQAKGLGGTLTLGSEGLGHGVTATLRLPVATCCEDESEDEPEDPFWALRAKVGADPGLDVIYADDTKINRRVFGLQARHVNPALATLVVEDGAQAVAAFKEATAAGTRISMVILDMEMPNMRGDAAAEAIRALGFTGYLVLLSGNEFGSRKEQTALRKTFDLLLVKGSTPSLKDLLEAYVRHRTTTAAP